MLQNPLLRTLCSSAFRGQLLFVPHSRAFSSRNSDDDDAAALDAARKWFSKFNESSIPMTISKTRFSNSSGPGGQKTNKTSSKATTVWPVEILKYHIPKLLHPELRSSRYYVSSSDSFSIQSDVHRSQTDNKDETRRRFNEEIREIYQRKVPGVTSPEQKARVEQLLSTPRGGWTKFFTANKISGKEAQHILAQHMRDKAERKKIARAEEHQRRRMERDTGNKKK